MDPAHATRAIWLDPLSYDPMTDGPPYLPHQTGGKVAGTTKAEVRVMIKKAQEEIGPDLAALFDGCLQKYGEAPMGELAVLLACIRAEAMIHQAHHWQTRGANYYGDHQLFMRIYEAVDGFIDGLAERVVGSCGHMFVQPMVQIEQVEAFSKLFYATAPINPEASELPLLSLQAVLTSLAVLQKTYDALEVKGQLSNGTDNLLQGIADKQEELVYLLKQRTKMASALDASRHEKMTHRVASRFAVAAKGLPPEKAAEITKFLLKGNGRARVVSPDAGKIQKSLEEVGLSLHVTVEGKSGRASISLPLNSPGNLDRGSQLKPREPLLLTRIEESMEEMQGCLDFAREIEKFVGKYT